MDRLDWLRRAVILVFVPLGIGLIYLQVFSYGRFKNFSEGNSVRTLYLDIPRGKILDRNGEILAEDKLGFNLTFVPFDLSNPKRCADILAPILQQSRSDLLQIFSARYPNPFEIQVLARGLSQEQLHFVEEQLAQLGGIYIQAGLERRYPLGEHAATIVGYLGEVNRDELASLRNEGVRSGDLLGRAGIERIFDALLRGERGGTSVVVDARGHQIRILGQKESKPGNSIVLTIDAGLQRAASEKLGDRPGSVVILAPATGEVLALVSKPSYDPYRPAAYLFSKSKPMLNRALTGLYAPGSVFKIITAIAALEEGAITPDDQIECTGVITLGEREFHCWKEEGHGAISFKSALAQSCNIFFGEAGMKTGESALLDYALRAGLGVPTGIDLPGEKSGSIPEPGESGGALNLSIGQGALLLTPVQMASLIATVANGGNIMRPEVIRELRTPDGTLVEKYGPALRGSFFVSEGTLKLLREALRAVVDIGTGHAAAVPGIPVAGKTGTAQTAQRDLNQPTRGSFVCYAPADAPELAVAVVLDSGASSEAAVIAGQIMRNYFLQAREAGGEDTAVKSSSEPTED
ncbi:MAG TPA: penicillin-binding protein 2 [bacterium]|nr:penicillin-binding protein 2 [bacterium]HNS48620.1 penicillin-binding protein 2 [bacterium]